MKATRTMIYLAIAAALVPGIATAQDSKNQGYLVDSYGNHISTSSNTELCWRSSDWTPARSVEPCDPVAKIAVAAAPIVEAAAPPPPPKVAAAPVQAPAPMAPQSVNFSADALFAFDKSALKPEGKSELDNFARSLGGVKYESIFVTGHTDRLGTSAYNQSLSQRRANAVKDYLVSRDVPGNRISADGKGETQPVTRMGDCKGGKSASLISCLQPDRRVHVQLNGTKAVTTSAR